MKKEKEEGRLYVVDFIRLKQGVDTVANETGISRATLFQFQQGRNGISPKTANRLAAYYEDFDKNKALGIKEAKEGQKSTVSPESDVFGELVALRIEMGELRSMLDRKDEQIVDLIGQLKEQKALSERWQLAYLKLTQPNLFADHPDIKIESSSHATVKELVDQQTKEWEEKQQRRQIGYHAEADTKVVELYPSPKVIELYA